VPAPCSCPQVLAALLTANRCLTSLDVSGNRIVQHAHLVVAALTELKGVSPLRALDLTNCGIGACVRA
jgi:hypothetical protein